MATDIAIGKVETSEGDVWAVRADGSRVELQAGDQVFQGDLLETGDNGAVGVTFADGSAFSLGGNGEMTIDQLVYDPLSQTGESFFSVVQGTFSFVSGAIAKTNPDAMTVETPVATIGVRGTKVVGQAGPEGTDNSFTLMKEDDGQVGEIIVYNESGVQVLNRPGETVSINFRTDGVPDPVTLSLQDVGAKYVATLRALPQTDHDTGRNTDDEFGPGASEVDQVLDASMDEEAGPDLPDEAAMDEEGTGEEPVLDQEIEAIEEFEEVAGPGEPVFDEAGPPVEGLEEGFRAGPEGPFPGAPAGMSEAIAEEVAGPPQDGVQEVPMPGDIMRMLATASPETVDRVISALQQMTGATTIELVPEAGSLFGGTAAGIDNTVLSGPTGDQDTANASSEDDDNDNDEAVVASEVVDDIILPGGDDDDDEESDDDDDEESEDDDDGDNLVLGGDDDDTLNGSDDVDTIYGGKGDDTIVGGAGGDVIDGGEDKDLIYGDAGADSILGGKGDDTIHGGAGNDVIDGGEDKDLIYGGDGADSILGGKNDDTIHGGAGDDVIDGGADKDLIYGGAGADSILGGENDDTIHGGAGNDNLDGGGDKDTIHGDAGDDVIRGGDKDDTLYGGTGDDVIDGGEDDDFIESGAGADSLTGGTGKDTFSFQGTGDGYQKSGNGVASAAELASADLITDFTSGEDTLLLNSAGFGNISTLIDGANYVEIDDTYDGTNAGIVSGVPSIIKDGDGTIYYDDNGTGDGYTIVARTDGQIEMSDIDVETV